MKHIKSASLQAFLDQELPLKKRKHVNEHLASCDGCREKLENAKVILKNIQADLALLYPDQIPEIKPFAILFDPVRVPSFFLFLMGSAILILGGLLFLQRRPPRTGETHPGEKTEINFLTVITEREKELIHLNIPLERFHLVEDPIIFILEETKR
jgi:hypothetical protein